MHPVEINAGAWYLRALRLDERIPDAPALAELGVPDPADYVAAAEADAERCVWGVCIPTTGEVIALIGVDGGGGLRGIARDGYAGALADAQEPVRRYALGGLDLAVGPLIDALP